MVSTQAGPTHRPGTELTAVILPNREVEVGFLPLVWEVRGAPAAPLALSVRCSRKSSVEVLDSQYPNTWLFSWPSIADPTVWMMRSNTLVRSASKERQCSSDL